MQVGQERPSYAELADLVVAQARVIEQLRAEVTELRAENAELKRRLGMNSTSSSQPPSSDGLAKPARKSLRGKAGRAPGGQTGHSGSTLTPIAIPDEVIRHEPRACAGCGAGLADAAEVGVTRRQVFDLPEIAVRVTEHQLVARHCGCGFHRADRPRGIATSPSLAGRALHRGTNRIHAAGLTTVAVLWRPFMEASTATSARACTKTKPPSMVGAGLH